MTDIDYKSLFIEEPFEVYLKQSEKYLTSHQLADFIKCPKIYYMRKVGAMPPKKSGADLLLGTAAHTLILEGREEFDRQYAVGGPVNEKTGNEYGRETKAYEKWAEIQRAEKGSAVEFITTTQWYMISNMARSIRNHSYAADLLSSGFGEHVLRANLHGVESQSRFDWFRLRGNTPLIIDLKTTQDMDGFEEDAKKYLYNIQFAFYYNMLLCALDEANISEADYDTPEVWVVVVEKKEPFRCGVFFVPHNFIIHQCCENRKAIQQVEACRAHSVWPTGFESPRPLSF